MRGLSVCRAVRGGKDPSSIVERREGSGRMGNPAWCGTRVREDMDGEDMDDRLPSPGAGCDSDVGDHGPNAAMPPPCEASLCKLEIDVLRPRLLK